MEMTILGLKENGQSDGFLHQTGLGWQSSCTYNIAFAREHSSPALIAVKCLPGTRLQAAVMNEDDAWRDMLADT